MNSLDYQRIPMDKYTAKDYDSLPQICNRFHQGINKWLTDQQSSQRLYLHYEWFYDSDEFGVQLMTQQQSKVCGVPSSYPYEVKAENHDNTFTSAYINNTLQQYETIGLFSDLSAAELAAAKKKVACSEISSYIDLMLCFPTVLIALDWESLNEQNPYEEITLAFKNASHGSFKPSKIKDQFAESLKNHHKFTTYSFTCKVKIYSAKFAMNRTWLDQQLLTLIRQALQDQQSQFSIYSVFSRWRSIRLFVPDLATRSIFKNASAGIVF